MNLKCEDIGLTLIINEHLIEVIHQAGLKHYPKEFGGLLIGRYSDDMKTCFVEETILPVKYKSSKSYFERGKEGVLEKLEVYYKQTPKLMYLGEWHTHPDSTVEPSETDKNTMKEIAAHDDVLINSPVMLILGITKSKLEIGAYIQFKNKLYKYEK